MESRSGGPADRLLLVASSPRLPAGVLSWQGWEALRSGPVYASDPDAPQAQAVRAAGIEVSPLPRTGTARPVDGVDGVGTGEGIGDDRARAAVFRDLARGGRTAVWLAGPDGEPGFAQALGDIVAREGTAELEVVYGSWDPPGARLLDVVATMDRLRSPGGCPWDAAQTHESLMPHLLEEAYEAYQALEDGDPVALREELGDVLLQVAFHSRLAEEADEGWSIDDVAGDLVDKLVRRHPHVFADVSVSGAEEVHANWQEIKRAEKRRESVTEGVPLALPALTLAATLQRKAAEAGLPQDLPGEGFGHRLFDLVREARAAGADPEAALRAVCREYRDTIVAAERTRRSR